MSTKIIKIKKIKKKEVDPIINIKSENKSKTNKTTINIYCFDNQTHYLFCV